MGETGLDRFVREPLTANFDWSPSGAAEGHAIGTSGHDAYVTSKQHLEVSAQKDAHSHHYKTGPEPQHSEGESAMVVLD